jgi:hypothetical protein
MTRGVETAAGNHGIRLILHFLAAVSVVFGLTACRAA